MSPPQIAIIGRPNVGKSSLLNRLARKRISIVSPTPGVTRDRISTAIEIDAPTHLPKGMPSRQVEVVDTGGYGAYTAEGGRYDDIGEDLTDLVPQIEAQIMAALAAASVILLVVDAQAGLTPLDWTIAGIIRRHGAANRVLCVANKVDSERWISEAQEAASLGFGTVWSVSATNGFGFRALLEHLYERVPETVAETADRPMKLAIVAKRNAGKSTLINTLAGEPRVIVSEIAGTTRDAVDVRFEIEGRTMIAIDTAGVRKKKAMTDVIEHYAYDRLLAAIKRADVAVFLIDATVEVSHVDKKLADELQRQCKPTVIAVNKWDLVADKLTPEDYLEYLTEQLRGMDYAPMVFLSAETGEGTRDVIKMAFNLYRQASHQEPTGRLNRMIQSILEQRGPTSRLGRQAKIFYAAQIATNPPTIVLVVNNPELFEGQYERYLMNRLHEELGCSEVPIRLLFRERKRVQLDELKARR